MPTESPLGTDAPAEEAPLLISVERGVATLRLNRPQALNAFDGRLAREFLQALRATAADPSVRCVHITGTGRAFSAGADVKTQFASTNAKAVVEREMRELTSPTILAIRDMPKPVLAAVNGPAAGLGCSVALACDLVLAAESAYFLLAFANIGLTPDGGASLTVAVRAGLGRALRMGLLAERVPAAQAVECGLADEMIPDAELGDRATELAARLAAGPTRSYAATKRAVGEGLLAGLRAQLDLEATLQGELVVSEDFAEGVDAFAQRRPARFSGR